MSFDELNKTDLENREAFEEWYKEEDPFHGNDDNDDVIWAKKFMFKAWQASAQRQGFKLVPIEPTKGMLRELSSNDMNGRMIYKAMIDAV